MTLSRFQRCRSRILTFAVALGFAATFAASAVRAAAPAKAGARHAPAGYRLLKEIPLHSSGWWDYLTIDQARQRLFIAHGDHVVVWDIKAMKRLTSIPKTQGVHGIALAPKLHRGFISDGQANQVTVFNLDTLKVIKTVPVTGKNPDAIVFDPASNRVFTLNGRTGNSTVIDAKQLKVIGTISLGGKPEFATADGKGFLFNNLEDKSELLKIDTRKLRIVNRWPLAPCEHPSGMAIDRANERVFSGCHNQLMAMVDGNSGKVLSTVPIGEGVDANRYFSRRHLAFSSNGQGTLTVARVLGSGMKLLGDVKTMQGARTMALDRRTGRIFLVTAQFGPPPAPTPAHPHPWPVMKPNSFTLLVVGRK